MNKFQKLCPRDIEKELLNDKKTHPRLCLKEKPDVGSVNEKEGNEEKMKKNKSCNSERSSESPISSEMGGLGNRPGEDQARKNKHQIVRKIFYHHPDGMAGGIEIERTDGSGEQRPGELNPVGQDHHQDGDGKSKGDFTRRDDALEQGMRILKNSSMMGSS
jgi:hypothetical protein